MITDYEQEICAILVSQYENRYKNASKFKQKISLKFNENGYKKYVANNAYKYRNEIDEAVSNLANIGFIVENYYPASRDVSEVILVSEKVAEIYKFIKKDCIGDKYSTIFQAILEMQSDISTKFYEKLNEKRLAKKSIQKYIENSNEYIDALVAIAAIQALENDTYIRNLSVRIFGDSKRLEKIVSHIVEVFNLSYDTDLGIDEFFVSYGVLKNPNYIHLKGSAVIKVNEQIIDLRKLKTTFSICNSAIDNMQFLEIESNLITTVENLTTFNVFNEEGLIIYLGGFSNHSKVKLLKKIGVDCINANFRHFGDIDLGGFLILKHLRENTTLNIYPHNMDISTIKKYVAYAKVPNAKYINKLKELLSESSLFDCTETIEYLISNEIILEQEAIDNPV